MTPTLCQEDNTLTLMSTQFNLPLGPRTKENDGQTRITNIQPTKHFYQITRN